MRIVTWNINGIRACKQPFKEELSDLASDIVCLQETKITRDLLDEGTAIQDGYTSYFSFSKKRSGYSGVATYCKTHVTPLNAEEGLSGILTDNVKGGAIGHYGDLSEFTDEELMNLDSEGRAILTEHQYRDTSGQVKHVVIINVYCPRADPDREGRLEYKLQFYKLLQRRAEGLLQANKHVIILGDFNVSHKPIDHCDPDSDKEKFYTRPSRQWLDQLLGEPVSAQPKKKLASQKKTIFIDTFRFFHPNQGSAFTAWSTRTNARLTNYGTRIDYIVSDEELCQKDFKECEILQDFEGSDHCPVRAVLKGTFEPCDKIPVICTKFMPEFLGKQQKLSSFFTKGVTKDKITTTRTSEQSSRSKEGCRKEDKTFQGKRQMGSSEFAPSAKRSKGEKKNKSAKTITSFFKKMPSAPTIPKGNDHQDKWLENVDQARCEYKLNNPEEHPIVNKSADSLPVSLGPTPLSNSDERSNSQTRVGDKGEINTGAKKKKPLASSWREILRGLPPAPLCKGHQLPCLHRTVKKPGPNLGKQFYICCKPEGHKSNPAARCNHFEWIVNMRKFKDTKSNGKQDVRDGSETKS